MIFTLNLFAIFILLMGNISMANAHIKFFTSSYPNIYGEPLKSEIWMECGNEFFLKNSNSYNQNDNSALQGVGLVVRSDVSDDEYQEIKNKILILNKNNHELFKKYYKHKKLNVLFKDNNTIQSGFILFDSKDSEQKKIIDWFESKKNKFLTSKENELVTGFTIDTQLSKDKDGYNVEIFFKNKSDKDIIISGLDEWSNKINSKKYVKNVKITFGSGFNIFSIVLDKSKVVSINQEDLFNIILEKNSDKKINFKLNFEDLSEVIDYIENNPKDEFIYSIVVNLQIKSPAIISGKFKYDTMGKKFI